jgi:hypothetical protein
MQRQQDVLLPLRQQLDPCSLVFRLPELLDIVRDSLWTNVPIDSLPDLLAGGSRVKADQIQGYMFWPPDIPGNLDATAIATIQQMVANAFVPTTPGSLGHRRLPVDASRLLAPGIIGATMAIYLDHAASTPLRPEVLAAMTPYLTTHFGNRPAHLRPGGARRPRRGP